MTIRSAASIAVLATAFGLAGCASKSQTQIQLRDADTKEALVGESIGKMGSLHLAHKWRMTDTNGAAYIRTDPKWETLDIVVGSGESHIDARGTLQARSSEWLLLTPEPGSTRRIEALLVSGEGAPDHISAQPH
jgi:hypothetical protein